MCNHEEDDWWVLHHMHDNVDAHMMTMVLTMDEIHDQNNDNCHGDDNSCDSG